MKKYMILALSLCLSAGLGAQNPPEKPARPASGTSQTNVSARTDEGRLLQEKLKKATQDFMASPDSKEAENKFIEAQKAVFTYQKEQAAARAKKLAADNRAKNIQLAEARYKAAKETLEQAKAAFEKQMDSQQARDAFIKAQKAVFEARKAMQPLILVDGKERPSLAGIEKNNIKSFSVLKNQNDLKPYGEKGKNGVILVTTYGNASGKEPMEQMRMRYLDRAIGLKDNQKESFEKTYGSYTEQIEALRRENKSLAEKTTWQNALEKILKNNITIEQKRYEMYKSLQGLLTDEQLAKLYRADLRFAREMMSKGGGMIRPSSPEKPGDNSKRAPGAADNRPGGSQKPARPAPDKK